MSNYVVNNTEIMKQFFENLPETMKKKYLWIPIAGITLSGVLDSFIKSIRENNCEAHIKIGDLLDMKLIPSKEQVIQ